MLPTRLCLVAQQQQVQDVAHGHVQMHATDNRCRRAPRPTYEVLDEVLTSPWTVVKPFERSVAQKPRSRGQTLCTQLSEAGLRVFDLPDFAVALRACVRLVVTSMRADRVLSQL